jgi:hypothetical protein
MTWHPITHCTSTSKAAIHKQKSHSWCNFNSNFGSYSLTNVSPTIERDHRELTVPETWCRSFIRRTLHSADLFRIRILQPAHTPNNSIAIKNKRPAQVQELRFCLLRLYPHRFDLPSLGYHESGKVTIWQSAPRTCPLQAGLAHNGPGVRGRSFSPLWEVSLATGF